MVADFRYELLPRVARREINQLGRLRRSVGRDPLVHLSRWVSANFSAANIQIRLGRTAHIDTSDLRLLRSALSLELSGPAGSSVNLLIDARLSRWLAAQQLAVEPTELEFKKMPAIRGLVGFAITSLLESLGPGALWNLVGESDVEQLMGRWLTELEVHLPDFSGRVWVAIADESLQQLDRRPTFNMADSPLGRLSHCLVDLPIVLGRIRLGKAEVHQLGVGDIIISPTVPNSIDGELRLEVGQQGYFSVDVEASGRQLNIRSGYCRGVSNMTTEEMAEQRKNLAEDLPVELVLELGRHRLSGEEVLSLGAGDVLTLNRPLVGGIDLRVGGKLVARGELVDVEGEAGVRLLEMVE